MAAFLFDPPQSFQVTVLGGVGAIDFKLTTPVTQSFPYSTPTETVCAFAFSVIGQYVSLPRRKQLELGVLLGQQLIPLAPFPVFLDSHEQLRPMVFAGAAIPVVIIATSDSPFESTVAAAPGRKEPTAAFVAPSSAPQHVPSPSSAPAQHVLPPSTAPAQHVLPLPSTTAPPSPTGPPPTTTRPDSSRGRVATALATAARPNNDAAPESTWMCVACTFENSATASACAICETARIAETSSAPFDRRRNAWRKTAIGPALTSSETSAAPVSPLPATWTSTPTMTPGRARSDTAPTTPPPTATSDGSSSGQPHKMTFRKVKRKRQCAVCEQGVTGHVECLVCLHCDETVHLGCVESFTSKCAQRGASIRVSAPAPSTGQSAILSLAGDDPARIEWSKLTPVVRNLLAPPTVTEATAYIYASFASQLKITASADDQRLTSDAESHSFRYRLYRTLLRLFGPSASRAFINSLILGQVTSDPLPDQFPQQLTVAFHTGSDASTTSCRPSDTFASLLARCWPGSDPTGMYVLRLPGLREYVLDLNIACATLCYVRTCVKDDVAIRFHVVSIHQLEESARAQGRFSGPPGLASSASLRPAAASAQQSVAPPAASSQQLTSSASSPPERMYLQDAAPALKLLRLVHRDDDRSPAASTATTTPAASPAGRRAARAEGRLSLDFRALSTAYRPGLGVAPMEKVQASCILVSDVHLPPSLKIIGLENFDPLVHLPSSLRAAKSLSYFTEISLVYGGEDLCRKSYTTFSLSPLWTSWLSLDIMLKNVPPEARLTFTVYACNRAFGSATAKPVQVFFAETAEKDRGVHPLAWVNLPLTDWTGAVQRGQFRLRMWIADAPANPIGSVFDNNLQADQPALTLVGMLSDPPYPIVYMKTPKATSSVSGQSPPALSQSQIATVERLLAYDLLQPLAVEERELLWTARDYIRCSAPHRLNRVLSGVSWVNPAQRAACHQMLQTWPLFAPQYALVLLDPKFADTRVRNFAVSCLDQLSDNETNAYLLQLVQAIKYEPRHSSSLAQFLVIRAIQSPVVGHRLFWLLRAEIDLNPSMTTRFLVILDGYLSECDPALRQELFAQMDLIKQFKDVGLAAKKWPRSARAENLARLLNAVALPSNFGLPINPRLDMSGLVKEKCKCMQSNAVPIWLTFANADRLAGTTAVIFKVGDDLRKDILVLQMFDLMDKLWKKEGLDLLMHPYAVTLTGFESGMIEVVPNSVTTATLHKLAGGATGAFKDDAIYSWLRAKNPTPELWELASANFVRSCAGYCVATYILGIGDRHNDNIMIKENGCLFHIDFAHVLGEFLKFAFIERETAPFLFTPEFLYTMGGDDSVNYARFCDLAGRAYNILRHHADLFFSLFSLMLSAGIAGLSKYSDLHYVRTAFSLDLSDDDAAARFQALIVQALGTKRTRINNLIHILAN